MIQVRHCLREKGYRVNGLQVGTTHKLWIRHGSRIVAVIWVKNGFIVKARFFSETDKEPILGCFLRVAGEELWRSTL